MKKKWLVTGVAGFIGSHLAETLLARGQNVIGLDDLSSGTTDNLKVLAKNPDFKFHQGDIRDNALCMTISQGVNYILHHAAIGSVQKSIEDPALVNDVNNTGFINILNAARKNGVLRVVYASSSAVYGDSAEGKPRQECEMPSPLSPYAASKCANESNAAAFASVYGVQAVGLRYFNIFGTRQDPQGAYAAVIPKWISAMRNDEEIVIFGDGKTMRDFCAISDVASANLAAAQNTMQKPSEIYNIGSGAAVSLNELFDILKDITKYKRSAIYKDFRAGDIRVSCADITKAKSGLGYNPSTSLHDNLKQMIEREYRSHAA